MRRQVLALLLLLVILAACLSVGAAVTADRQDDVFYTEKILYGEPSAADGLTVSVRYGYQNRAYWFVDHSFGPEETDTGFRYYAVQPELDGPVNTSIGLEMRVAGDFMDMDWEKFFRQQDLSGYPGLLGAYKQLYDATPEGAVTNTYVRYADYCEYYPLYGYVDVPLGAGSWHVYETDQYSSQARDAFSAYFRIPVLPDSWVQMIVDKQQGQYQETIEVAPKEDADNFEMGTVGICHENTVYFTFDAHTSQGNLVDTSLIPGGYGLYAFTYSDDGSIDYDSLTTLRTLDAAHAPLDMRIDEAHGHLLYFTAKDQNRYVTVIDLRTMEILQQRMILEHDGEKWQWYRVLDNCIISLTEDEAIDIYEKNAQGLFEFRYTAPLTQTTAAYFSSDMYDARYVFNGEYLAVVGTLYEEVREDDRHWYLDQKCGFSLSVFSEEGLLYSGQYTSSLEPAVSDSDKCRVCKIEPVWQ